MRLEEKHKEFVVRGYAQFMRRSEIVTDFMEEFNNEIFQLCSIHVVTESKRRDNQVNEYLAQHGIPITTPQLEEYENSMLHSNPIPSGILSNKQEYKKIIQHICKKAEQQLSVNFRRLNITHPKFPEKYRKIFNQAREEYLANYRSAHLSIPENVVLELETLYELTKELVFEKRDLKYINQATQILKTIATCNAINQQQKRQNVEHQDIKAIQDTQNALKNRLKKEARQLQKHTENQNA